MRTLVLLLMICLMPLRAWTGDAMALAHAPALQQITPHPHAHAEAHPCHAGPADHAQPHGPSATQPDKEAAHGHAGACGNCDICHSQIVSDTPPEWRSPELGRALRAEASWAFDSAHAWPCFKPPRA
ncbi:hypothetical protein [Hydrogenophaga sp. OTU3427]|uniref:hypothetical protein n=1 Tax=Hydrogenophaga sp. OTU3427 TaxID=3043856 RepID=UPI00313CEC7E